LVMAEFKEHPPSGPLLIGYDPYSDLPQDHLSRLVDRVVDECAEVEQKEVGPGQPELHPRLLLKILIYSYATGVFSSRRMEQNCGESLPYLLLTRGERPSYHTLSSARSSLCEELHWIWTCLFTVAVEAGIRFVGKISIDSTKLRANVSGESVICRDRFEELAQRLREILAKAAEIDAREDEEGAAVHTETGVPVRSVQMRDIVRSLGKPLDPDFPPPSKRMKKRIEGALGTLEMASASELKHVSLTDPDARMMPIGSQKTVRSGHSLEVSAESGLLLHARATQQPDDAGNLSPAVQEAALNAPAGVRTALADSGFFKREDVLALQEAKVNTVVPDANTACDLKRDQPIGTSRGRLVEFEYLEDLDAYRCPEGNLLKLTWRGDRLGRPTKAYTAVRTCQGCPLAAICLHDKKAKYRTLKIGQGDAEVTEYLSRFSDAGVKELYHSRGHEVETPFAFIRCNMGFDRWHLRGADGVAAETDLLKTSYQIRKLHSLLSRAA
jgi:transposase